MVWYKLKKKKKLKLKLMIMFVVKLSANRDDLHIRRHRHLRR